MVQLQHVAMLGAGSFGLAMAKVLAENGNTVTLWARREEIALEIRQHHRHPHKLNHINLPACVQATHSLTEAVDHAHLIVSALPMIALRSVFQKSLPLLSPQALVVSTTKGIEQETGKFSSQVLHEVLGISSENQTAFLSGPSFALEVAQNQPTALVIASKSITASEQVRKILQNKTLRLSTSNDVIGLEVCGAFKNVIAIAAGLMEGLGLGANAKAALLTKGLHEIARLVVALGGQSETAYGLGGIGDLVLTCYGELSRNRSVGIELALGRSIFDILDASGHVAEGVHTAKSVQMFTRQLNIQLPILENVFQVVFEKKDIREAVQNMLA